MTLGKRVFKSKCDLQLFYIFCLLKCLEKCSSWVFFLRPKHSRVVGYLSRLEKKNTFRNIF